MLAEGYAAAGRLDEGLGVLALAFEEVRRTGERWWEAELYRIKGELLRHSTDGVSRDVEVCFRTAMDIAGKQGAMSLRLRAAASLTRLLRGTSDTYDAACHARTQRDRRAGARRVGVR